MTIAVLGASSRMRNVTAGGVPIPSGWALQRLDTFGTTGSVQGPVRQRALYNEANFFGLDSNGRTFIPNSVLNGQQQTYQHFEDPTWLWMSDRLRIQGRGQGDNSIKSGLMSSKFSARSFMWEAKFTGPSTLGTWVEFWAYAGASGNDTSELDFEFLSSINGTSYTVHRVSMNNHPYSAPSGDPILDDPNATNSSTTGLTEYNSASFDRSTGPHYYTIYYDDTGGGTVRRYIDGVLIYHFPNWKWNNSLGGTGFGPNAIMNIDLAVGTTFGGQFPGTVASPSTWSGDMDIYSIGFYTPGSAGRAIPAGQAWSFSQINAHVTLSNNDLTVTTSTNAIDQPCYALDAVVAGTGKYYWEIVVNNATATPGAGIGTYLASIADTDYVGKFPYSICWFDNGQVFNNGAVAATWAAFGPGSVRLCFALDMVNLRLWGRVGAAGNWNNAAIGSQNPATPIGGLALPSAVQFNVVPAVNLKNTSDTATGAFASGSWVGTPPSGFGQIGPT